MSRDVESLFDRIGQADLNYRVFDNLPSEDGGVVALRAKAPAPSAQSQNGSGLLRAYATKVEVRQAPAPSNGTSLAALFTILASKATDAA